MKNLKSYIGILFILGFTSCVQRIDIPADSDLKLVVELEMLRGEELTAKAYVSADLSGTFPIEHPEDLDISIYPQNNFENIADFVYDPERKLYYSARKSTDFVNSNQRIVLNAKLDSYENVSKVTSLTRVPRYNSIDSIKILSEEFVTINGEQVWQGEIEFQLADLNTNNSLYYQLFLNERYTEIVGNDYKFGDDIKEFNIVDVVQGAKAISKFYHLPGLYINVDNLESESIVLKVQSNFPNVHKSQVHDIIFAEIVSHTEEHYNYHLGLDNINKTKNDIFGEPALYRSNINNGLGVFSSSVKKKSRIKVTR